MFKGKSKSLSSDPSCKQNVTFHKSFSGGVGSAETGILKKWNDSSLSGLLQGVKSSRLEPKLLSLEV